MLAKENFFLIFFKNLVSIKSIVFLIFFKNLVSNKSIAKVRFSRRRGRIASKRSDKMDGIKHDVIVVRLVMFYMENPSRYALPCG